MRKFTIVKDSKTAGELFSTVKAMDSGERLYIRQPALPADGERRPVLQWLSIALVGISAWGVWGCFSKLAINAGLNYLILTAMGATAILLTSLATFWWSGKAHISALRNNLTLSVLSGLFGGIGQASFFFALRMGAASLVVPLFALYPVITTVLSCLFLKERLSMKQGLGVLFAVVAALLLSM